MNSVLHKLIFLVIGCFSFIHSVNAQSTLSYKFEGFFNGINLNVQCRDSKITPWVACSCFDSIAVNGKTYNEILYEGFQIDLANKTELKMNEAVAIEFYYKQGCDFRLLNPNDFGPNEILPIKDISLTSQGHVVKWVCPQLYPQLKMWVQVEQYRWGTWIKCGQNFTITEAPSYSADLSPWVLKGENKFRLVVSTIDGIRIPSEEIVFKAKQKKVKCKIKKGIIKFSENTYYEIYDDAYRIAEKGFADQVTILKVLGPPGNYILRYGNKLKKFKKGENPNIPDN